MPQPIDIVMVTYFRLGFTKEVIRHIIDRTKPEHYRLIIVDNGSTDGTREYLQKLKSLYPINVKAIKLLPKNYGLQAAKNIGLELVESPLFVDTDNDCLCPKLEPDWISQLEDLMRRYPEFGAISLRPQVLVGVGPIFNGAQEVVENNVAGGSFRMMRSNLVRQVGGWENVFENRHEEWNICGKLRQLGYKVGYSRDIFTYHMFGENWGYDKVTPHYHNPSSEIYARDVEYDPITCEPRIKCNQ